MHTKKKNKKQKSWYKITIQNLAHSENLKNKTKPYTRILKFLVSHEVDFLLQKVKSKKIHNVSTLAAELWSFSKLMCCKIIILTKEKNTKIFSFSGCYYKLSLFGPIITLSMQLTSPISILSEIVFPKIKNCWTLLEHTSK